MCHLNVIEKDVNEITVILIKFSIFFLLFILVTALLAVFFSFILKMEEERPPQEERRPLNPPHILDWPNPPGLPDPLEPVVRHNYFNQFTLVGSQFVNNITFILLFIFIICLLLLITKINKPSGYQSGIEGLFNTLTGLSKDNMKELKFFPILFSLFFLLVSLNSLGLLPYNITVTSLIIVTFGLSLTVVISALFLGFEHYLEDYCSLFMPGGAPLILSPFLVIIETISYASRAISLGVRLAANLSAGHLLFVILASFGFFFIKSWLIIFPVWILFFITLLEMAVAGIQAYVFSLLTAIYIGDALKLH